MLFLIQVDILFNNFIQLPQMSWCLDHEASCSCEDLPHLGETHQLLPEDDEHSNNNFHQIMQLHMRYGGESL